MQFSGYFPALALVASALIACGSDNTDAMPTSTATSSAQLPPSTNSKDVEAWLEKASYKDWSCETAAHPQIKVSPHGHNLVCINDLIAAFTGAVGAERPKGSAAVKELFDDSDKLVGYAVSVKLADKSNGGTSWYWYERNADGVVADGKGDTGVAKSLCVACHQGAGSDTDMHDVNTSSDFVYDVVN